jgi:hypothetical protein
MATSVLAGYDAAALNPAGREEPDDHAEHKHERGGLDSDEDEQAIHRFMRLLGGPASASAPPAGPGSPASATGRG